MKADLHVHASERSYCAGSSESEMIAGAMARELDAIAFCDHQRLVPADRLAELNRRHAPFRVFAGIELDVEGEHVLVLGLHDPELERRAWDWPDLHRFVRDRGGASMLAHPYRFSDSIDIDVERFKPDALEVDSCNMDGRERERIEALARDLDVPCATNSDAHHCSLAGRLYNVLERPAASDAELAEILRQGAFHPARLD